MTLPEISLAQANRYLLKRQHLLEPCLDPLQATIDACGLQAQVPSSPALSLRNRVKGFTLADYDRLLVAERKIVRTWAMRGTIHVVPADRLPIYTSIYADESWPTPAMLQAMDLLKEGPLTRKQLIVRAIEKLGLPREQAERLFGPWGGILQSMSRAGLTVHVPAAGAEVPVARVEDWLGPQPPLPAKETLEDRLFMAYARGYGPVTVRDFAHFSLLPVVRIRAIIERTPGLAQVRLEGSKLTHYIPQADLPELLATTGSEEAPVRLLPRFDSLVLAHKDKARILDEPLRRKVFKDAAVVEAVALIRGRIGGIWRMKTTARELRVEFHPFGRQPASAVKAEAARLGKWLGLERLAFDVI
ncbi:MAG TPA: winged helix DNA-binding domain-containing protein [Symbiobacteriaceae bacterium]|nr:winged helix DNA-binding domain-containing protein [Symbiobacteriaceae bacterium]